MTRFYPLPVADVRRETADAVSIALAVPDVLRQQFAFLPGQYLTVRVPINGAETRRSYSICSGLDDTELRIAVKRVEGGAFSTWAHGALQPGATLDVMPPEGRFTFCPDHAAARHYAGIAAGSGITPVLSILRSVLSREPRSRFTLLYGSRSTSDILFRDALEDLKDRHMGRLTVAHVLSREQGDVPVLHGRLDGARALRLLGPAAATLDGAFLCGPAAMIEDVTAALSAAGLPGARIHNERFSTGAPLPPRPIVAPVPGAAPFAPAFAIATVISDGVQARVPMQDGETVLDAALRAGLDLPYSCRGGMCSTCRARVTAGTVHMDLNYGLEPWETAAGFVLTCQAHPVGGDVTVDFDHV